MLNIIFLGILAAALAGGAFAIKSSIEEKGANKVRAQWSALIQKCGKRNAPECAQEWTDAVAKNVSLQADVARIDGERQQCTASVNSLGEQQKAIQDAKVKTMAEVIASKRLASVRVEIIEQRAKAQQAPKKGVSCEEILDAVDISLTELAARRMLFSPVDDSSGGSKVTPSGSGSSPGAVRITPRAPARPGN